LNRPRSGPRRVETHPLGDSAERKEAVGDSLRRRAAQSWLLGDAEEFRRLMREAGRLYAEAAEERGRGGMRLKAAGLYLRAASCVRDGGVSSEPYDRSAEAICRELLEGLESVSGEPEELRPLGWLLASKGDYRGAGLLYERAGVLALETGRPLLASVFYADAAGCYWRLNDPLKAAVAQEAAALHSLEAGNLYEAAWGYVRSSLQYAAARVPGKAREAAQRAGDAAQRTEDPGMLLTLAEICLSLSGGDANGARERWLGVRWKFENSFSELVEASLNASG